ncbi:MAG: thiamine phosphate synthase [Victivallales bacterium]|nr:thiamine phosphate synthase [Victivallales bacterium]
MTTPRSYTTHAERLDAFKKTDVYPVVTSDFCNGRNPVAIAKAILEGGAKILQIREKTMMDGDFLQLLKQIRPLATAYGALLIVDDRVDAALAANADGVHLGQEDFPVADTRKIAPELLIGTSTHNEMEIDKAQKDGCSYLNIGPIFPTKTKQLNCVFLGLENLRVFSKRVTVPFSVMGGIKYEHLAELRACGARHVAAVTAFTLADDPSAEIARWRECLK